MALLSKWHELIITQDFKHFLDITALLKANNIVCKEKIQNIGHGNRRNGQLGGLGENSNYSNIYQIFVKQHDFEHAKMLIKHHH